MKSIIISLAALALSTVSAFTGLKQCDPRWSNEAMFTKADGSNMTLCEGGSTVVALSMVLHDCDVRVNNQIADPQVLNHWLRASDGYNLNSTNGNYVNFTSIESLGKVDYVGPTAPSSLDWYLEHAYVALLRVEGNKWLLADESTGSYIHVYDPLNNTVLVNTSDILEAQLYSIPYFC